MKNDAYNELIKKLDSAKSDFGYLKVNSDIILNKYQMQCFEQIINDINDMQSFVKALKFIIENKNQFMGENNND
ncbi:MAG: hypothetical protein WC346_17210 [Methanogenium sp.]|jgi:hypothetical protein